MTKPEIGTNSKSKIHTHHHQFMVNSIEKLAGDADLVTKASNLTIYIVKHVTTL